MYSLSIFFGPSPVPAQFLFKDKEKAKAAFEKFTVDGIHKARSESADLANPSIKIEDDYGQIAAIFWKLVHGAVLEDMDLGEESRIQRGLSQARGQANANKRAQADPVIMAAQRGQGPSVLTPFGNGRFNG